MSKFLHHFVFVGHDDDGRDEKDHADGVLRIKAGVLEMKLQYKVQDHLETAEHVGLARADPPGDQTGGKALTRMLKIWVGVVPHGHGITHVADHAEHDDDEGGQPLHLAQVEQVVGTERCDG